MAKKRKRNQITCHCKAWKFPHRKTRNCDSVEITFTADFGPHPDDPRWGQAAWINGQNRYHH